MRYWQGIGPRHRMRDQGVPTNSLTVLCPCPEGNTMHNDTELDLRILMALERIATALEEKVRIETTGMEIANVIKGLMVEVLPGPLDLFKNPKAPPTHEVEVPVFDEASDDARDPTMEECPNCGVIGHVWDRHDTDHVPTDWFQCKACNHAWTDEENTFRIGTCQNCGSTSKVFPGLTWDICGECHELDPEGPAPRGSL